MGKRTKPVIANIQANGLKVERDLIRTETDAEAKKLADRLPYGIADRTMYLRSILQKALRGEVEEDVFKAFVRMTKTATEIQEMLPRAKMLVGGARR